MSRRKENPKSFLFALPLVYLGISTFLPTLSFANSASRRYSEEDIIAIKTAEIKERLKQRLRLTEEECLPFDDSDEGVDVSKLPPELLEKMQRDKARQEVDKEPPRAHFKKLAVLGNDMNRCITSKYGTGCYLFNLTCKIYGNVASAVLWFYKTQDLNDIKGQTIKVMELAEKSRSRSKVGASARKLQYASGVVEVKLLARHETRKREGWIKVDVKMDSRWTKQVMVAIQCKTCYNRHHKSLFGHEAGYQPLLVLYYDEPTFTMMDDDCDPETDCCRKELVINFKQIGWRSIIQPETLAVGYCHGTCRTSHQAARIHDSELNRTTRNEHVPCCVATGMSARSFLLMRRGIMSKRDLGTAVVSMCGCV